MNLSSSTTDWWIYIASACLVGVTITYYFCISTFSKWEKLNVPYIRPIPLFGNFVRVALSKDHPLEFYNKIYYKFAGLKYGGLFQMRTPYLMIRDPEIINNVLIKDFSSFPDRGIYSDLAANPLSDNLFFMENPRWKTIRNKLTPAFTSGKLKTMYDQIKECGDVLMTNIDKCLRGGNEEIEVRDIMGKYSTDVIGTCAFGLKLNSISDDESPFRKYGKSIFIPSLRTLFRELCLMVTPSLLKVVRVKDFPTDATDFFHSAFKETIAYRLENKIVRNDFVNCLMQARNELTLNANLPKEEKFSESQIVANAFVMFAAGFETTSTTLSYILYELALNTSIQDKVRQEFQLKLSNSDGQIDNEFLMSLNYMDMVIAETLRKYPPLIALFRKASQTYRLPDNLILEKGQKIVIPIYSLHFDDKYFEDPQKFDPERFSPENKDKRPNGVYLPFGDGPRMCIGKRFAEMEMRLALLEMLSKFEVLPCEKTEVPLKYSNKVLTLMPKHGIWLKFQKIA
uniref:Cytochrome P450 n=1 Tax=Myzus persicae TaxID=13164 RepID=E7CGB1_MYZPE|nr:probable cytochrome P450 6a13 [Myzus persicae]ADL59603.1 cytochrome P450 [Myzus persicae]AHB52754.1 cytochrome P450 CYP6CY3 [Myzus persicae]AHB52755.1 cytochrome P450 CYP6CY3 [Myzus persicae]AHB52756.1 cytochrome P450 CYP6CY3 [Myzus persicae]